MIQLIVFVPENCKEQVKKAMFEAGAGKIGNYDSCCFEHHGTGQFRPLAGSHPHLGAQNILEKVAEVRLEFTCEDHLIEAIVKSMKLAHPYETPAYYAIKTLSL